LTDRVTPSGRPERIPSLTSLRFFAAFAVLGFHALVADPVVPDGRVGGVLRYVFSGGASGVSFFFVLSGFVLTWTARIDDPPPKFWRRRAAKIYPSHVLTWAVVLCGLAVHHETPSPGTTIATGTLLQAWVPAESAYFGINTPSWSLSCEVFFYLLFPFLIVALMRRSSTQLRLLAVVCAVLPSIFAAVSGLLPFWLAYWAIFVFPPVRLVEFCLGIALALLVKRDALPRFSVTLFALLAASAFVVAGRLPWQWGLAAVTIVPAALLICATAQRDVAGGSALVLHRPWLIRLGEASFALYLVHQIVLRFATDQATSDVVGIITFLAVVAISIVWALLQYRYWETPLYQRLSRPKRVPAHARSHGRQPRSTSTYAQPPVHQRTDAEIGQHLPIFDPE
jgi:peptidoglycan/LPS O-acetylase OafA/YrhL